jgi:hypothetical protein
MAARLVRPIPVLLVTLLVITALAAVAAPPSAQAVATPDTYFHLTTIGGAGSNPGQFGGASNPGPYSVATDTAGNVYVADPNTGCACPIQKFAPDGTLLCSVAPSGYGTGQVGTPYGIAVGPNDVVYAIDTWRPDTNTYRIQKFSPIDATHYSSAGGIDTPAIPRGSAFFLAVDGSGNIFVSVNNGSTHEILKYAPAGGAPVVISLGFNYPNGVAVDAFGDLYVSDSSVVKKLHSSDGGATYAVVRTWNGDGTG